MSLLSAKTKDFCTTEIQNIILNVLIAIIECFQLLVVMVYAYSFFPIDRIFTDVYLPEALFNFVPEREIFFYRFFVVSVMAFAGGMLLIFRKKNTSKEFLTGQIRFLIIESVVVCLMVFAIFRLINYKDDVMGKNLFICSLGLAACSKLFWARIWALISKGSSILFEGELSLGVRRFIDALVVIFIAVIIYVVDMRWTMIKIFENDKFYHFDGMFMGATWAYLKGCIPNVDVVSPYGVGLPIFIANLSCLFGKFSYEHVLMVLVFATIIYFALCYGFLRLWLKEVFICLAGVLWLIRVQMFHFGASHPTVWTFPTMTVIRYFFGIPALILIVLHFRNKKMSTLWLASFLTGVALFFMSATGIYQLLVLYAYLFVIITIPHTRDIVYRSFKDIISIGGVMVLPFLTAFALLWFFVGAHIFEASFWANTSEHVQFFLNGFGALPFGQGIMDKYYLASYIGFLTPIVFILSVVLVYILVLFQKIDAENIMAIVVSIYGLCLYHYYVCRSVALNHYVICMPFIFIVCYWVKIFLQSVKIPVKKIGMGVFVISAFFALLTSKTFLNYPNIFRPSREAPVEQTERYTKGFVHPRDVYLIQTHVGPEEKACVIGNFEVATSIAADRKPFFYVFPLVSSRFRDMIDFGGTYLFTRERLTKALDRLEKEKPAYVFVEKRFYKGKLLRWHYEHYDSLTIILKYLNDHYRESQYGMYYIVLERRK